MNTHHHTSHPGEYRPFGYDTTWCNRCDRPVDRQMPNRHECREDEIGRPCSYTVEKAASYGERLVRLVPGEATVTRTEDRRNV